MHEVKSIKEVLYVINPLRLRFQISNTYRRQTMDNDKQIQPKFISIKKVDKDGYDEEGVLHENCGTPRLLWRM